MSFSSETKNWETKIFSSELNSLICPMSSAVLFSESTIACMSICGFFHELLKLGVAPVQLLFAVSKVFNQSMHFFCF